MPATEYTNTHFAQTATYTAELTGITLEQAQKMRRTINPTSATPALIQPVIDAAVKYGAMAGISTHTRAARSILFRPS